jgi:hypothetical protein
MGYETDTLTLVTAGSTLVAGTWFTPTTAPFYFGGADFVRGHVRINVVTATTSPTALALGFQNSPDNGTTWYPTVTALPQVGIGGATAPVSAFYQSITATIAVGTLWDFAFSGFPGNLFRLALLATGGTGITVNATGEFQKWVPDNT